MPYVQERPSLPEETAETTPVSTRVREPDGRALPAPRVTLRFDGPCLAYRHDVVVNVPGLGPSWSHGALFLELDPEGVARVLPDPGGPPERRPLYVTDADAVQLYFPSPPGSLPTRRRLVIPRLDVLGTSGEVVFDEEVWLAHRDGSIARVEFRRVADLGSDTITQEGAGQFDLARGRYLDVRSEFRVQVPGEMSTPLGTVELSYDADRSRGRTAMLAALAREREAGDREYETFHRMNSARAELTRIEHDLDTTTTASTTSLISFHARANPVQMWKILLDRPEGAPRDRLEWALAAAPVVGGQLLDDEVVELIRLHLPRHRSLRVLVSRLGDERFRPELQALARSRDAEVRRAARLGLDALDDGAPPTVEQIRRLLRRPDRLAEGLDRYVETAADPRAVVPLLIELLGGPVSSPRVREAVLEALTSIALVELGDDARAWRSFLADHAERPYSEWLAEGARRDRTSLRLKAIGEIAVRAPTALGRCVLRDALDDAHPLIRLVAAEALTHYGGNRVAVARLIDALDASDFATRQTAFIALASVLDRSLGYEAHGPPLERARAIGRIRAWADAHFGALRPSTYLGPVDQGVGA